MKLNLGQLATLLTKIRTPLALAGLVVVVLYAIYRQILALDIFSRMGEQPTFQLITSIVEKLFWLALLAMALGVLSFLVSLILKRRTIGRQSKVHLIDASLDERDSAYRARVNENTGETDVSLKERKPKGGNDNA